MVYTWKIRVIILLKFNNDITFYEKNKVRDEK